MMPLPVHGTLVSGVCVMSNTLFAISNVLQRACPGRRDGHSPALIDCIFPLIGMMLGPKDCDGPHDLVSGLCEREEAMMAADFAWSTTQAECCKFADWCR